MRKHAAAEMGKSGQIRDTKPKTGQMGVAGELWFFPGHVVKKSGLSRKIRDGWSRYWEEVDSLSIQCLDLLVFFAPPACR